jgi:hypothetical protein
MIPGAKSATVTSPSHPAQTAWNPRSDVLFKWVIPDGDSPAKGIHYVLDHYGDTVPDARATFIAATQKQLLKPKVAAGVWVFHLVWVDKEGRFSPPTHYQVRIGTDPGVGIVAGTVYGDANQSVPISSAVIAINRGLFPGCTTSSMGKFGLNLPVGNWHVTASHVGFKAQTLSAAVPQGTMTTLSFRLAKLSGP